MKDRPFVYSKHQYNSVSEPQYVISIEFAPASFEYFASHAGITNIPAGTIESSVESFSSVSQQFDPETGASRIGSLTVQLGDIDGAVTDAFQARLVAGTGVRDKELVLLKGFAGMDFADFEIKWTQIVHEVTEDHARYTISCSDLQRAMRTEIFELKKTTLNATLSATAVTATVAATAEFILVEHGSSYSHGPSATWGYFLLDDEIIGYTGKTATTFTGLDRGMFNTEPALHIVDGADPPERRPEVEEYVYLELPIPKLVKAILTGVLHDQGGATLPAHWHMGIDIALIEDAQFTDIGVDLWDPANDAVGLIARFTEIDAIDGKRFLEAECFLLAQIFSPVLSSGKLGLRRFTPALATAMHLVTLNEQNVVKHTALKQSMREVFNRVVLNWSWISGEFRRQTIKLDADSIATHGEAPIKIYNFRGLAANIATQSVLTQRFDAIRDRFSAPPLSISVDVSKSLDRMELGDVCLVQLPNVRDMAAATVNPIDRAFEIRQIREDRKKLTFMLTGSSAEAVPEAPPTNALPDTFYDDLGTELSTVVPITGGVTDAGTSTLAGTGSLAASIFYFLGNLTIAAGTTINIDNNAELRIRGFLTINGTLNGVARGLAGVADNASVGGAPTGNLGFFGATVGGDGAEHDQENDAYITRPPRFTGFFQRGSVPLLNLNVNGDILEGLPGTLQGTSGGPGGKLVNNSQVQVGAGGTGGQGGSGLMIICRGLSFGGGGSIDLSGGDGLSASQFSLGTRDFFGGGGAGAAPGALYILLDGDRLVPSVLPFFTALGGNTPVDGNPIPFEFTIWDDLFMSEPGTGMLDNTRRLSDVDWTRGAGRIQFVPVPETPVEDLPDDDGTRHYILATAGNQIQNGVGQLTVEAHRVLAGTDELLSTGTIQLFDPGDNIINVANGYVTGSDGYTGILDAGDITGSIVVTLKDGPTGPVLDSMTLVDTLDGGTGPAGSDGADAVYGIIEPENGVSYTRATNSGPWTPSQATTDFDCTFFQDGAAVARIARRLTLNTSDGTFTAASETHKDGDLNTSRVNVTVLGSGSTAVTVQFDYSFGGEDASLAETVTSSQGGDDGGTGPAGGDGADAVTGFIEPENGLAWTRAPNAGAWTPSQLTTDLDCTFEQGGVVVARIARRLTLTSGTGNIAATSIAHKGGDLNTSRVTVTVSGGGSTAVTVQFDYDFGGEAGSAAATASSSQGGDDGATGGGGADGDDAVTGFVEPENGLAWVRATTGGAWTPSQLTTDLDCTFVQGGVEVARIARRITLTSSNGNLAATSIVHKGGDLNTSRVTVVVTGGGSTAITVKFSYSFGGDTGSDAATVASAQGGDDGVLHYLTNEAHVVSANSDGLGYSLTGSDGTHKLFEGTVDETTNATHSVQGGATKNGLTISVVAGTGVYTLSGAAWSTDLETFTLRAVFGGVNYEKTYTIAKARRGSDGGCATDTLTNITLSDIGVNDPAICGFRLASAGNMFTRANAPAGYVSKETWKGACLNSEYECRYNHSGDALTGGSASVNTWLLCSTTRTFELNTSGAAKSAGGTFQIRRESDGMVLDTANISLSVETNV